jgi:hypothetical protein
MKPLSFITTVNFYSSFELWALLDDYNFKYCSEWRLLKYYLFSIIQVAVLFVKKIVTYLLFVNPYDKNQLDALFTFNLFQ